MKWGVHLMALLIVFYQSIQQLQMEKTCFYVQNVILHIMHQHVENMLFFNHQCT
jgi:hypothetical protein